MFTGKLYRNFDKTLLIVIFILLALGLSAVYSATHTEGSYANREGLFFKQVIWVIVGLCIAFLVVHIDYQRFIDASYVLFGLTLLLLFLVMARGHTVLGAQRWLSIGGVGIQPSEFAKLTYILVLSSYLGHRAKFTYHITDLIIPAIMLGVPLILIILQPDLGTALLLLPIFFAMLFIRGAKVRHLTAIIIAGLLASPVLWFMLKDYQRQRLAVFINPNADPLGAGYTIIQSKIAIGSGFLFGKGWLSGTQNQLNFLPERHTDFIFSVVGEEGGFIGCMVLISLYSFLIYRGLRIIYATGDTYGKMLATGIVTMLASQIIVNIGMTAGFLPVVGIPLPLMSYGGSSLVATLLAVALLINIDIRKQRF